MLPQESGLDFVRWLREHTRLRIIMLTALGSTIDRVLGLEVLADDYVSKPFEPGELVARIRAVLRRAPARPPCGAHEFKYVPVWRIASGHKVARAAAFGRCADPVVHIRISPAVRIFDAPANCAVSRAAGRTGAQARAAGVRPLDRHPDPPLEAAIARRQRWPASSDCAQRRVCAGRRCRDAAGRCVAMRWMACAATGLACALASSSNLQRACVRPPAS